MHVYSKPIVIYPIMIMMMPRISVMIWFIFHCMSQAHGDEFLLQILTYWQYRCMQASRRAHRKLMYIYCLPMEII